ncbi:MAG: acylphosphatase [Desulfobulbaceae bacterium]|nr:acylphosphatase [Desulfobulbaceae bacterium]
MKSIHVIVEGKVQGVCFRDYTQRQARQLNLRGWVRNKRDGSVEAILNGDDSDLTAMLEWLQKGSPMSRVDNIHTEEIISEDHYTTFEVRY